MNSRNTLACYPCHTAPHGVRPFTATTALPLDPNEHRATQLSTETPVCPLPQLRWSCRISCARFRRFSPLKDKSKNRIARSYFKYENNLRCNNATSRSSCIVRSAASPWESAPVSGKHQNVLMWWMGPTGAALGTWAALCWTSCYELVRTYSNRTDLFGAAWIDPMSGVLTETL